MTIIEPHELIDITNNFFHDPFKRDLIVGGLAGTNIFHDIIDTATGYTDFENILMLDGCADYCYAIKPYVKNYIPYHYIFNDQFIGGTNKIDMGKVMATSSMFSVEHRMIPLINLDLIKRYPVVIINNAHLIDPIYVETISACSPIKCIIIVDPFDIGGEQFDPLTVVSTYTKQPKPICLARQLYGYETAIDKKIPGNVKYGKITKRGVGKLDGKMHICDNEDIVREVQNNQYNKPLKKGQRLFITDERHHIAGDTNGDTHVLSKNMMLIVEKAVSKEYFPSYFRPYQYRYSFKQFVRYDNIPKTRDQVSNIAVKPANILNVYDASHHRYMNTVFTYTTDHIPKRHLYSVMKNSVNLTICELRGG